MNLYQLKSTESIPKREADALEKIYLISGNCIMNGFLGENLVGTNYDDDGNFEFVSSKKNDEGVVDSVGVVLDDSVLIKQVDQGETNTYYKLYSWDVESGTYTFLAFDSQNSLNHFYNVIKRFGMNMCSKDISSSMGEMGLTFDNVTQVLLNQSVDPISRMFDEEMEKEQREQGKSMQ